MKPTLNMPTLFEYLRHAKEGDTFAQVCRRFFEPTDLCCPVHHEPIEVTEAYGTSADLTPTEAVWLASRDNPHHISIYYSLHPTELHDEPGKVAFCPRCESNYQHLISAFDGDT